MTNIENLELIRNMALFKKNYHKHINEKIKNYELTGPEFSYLKEVINNDGILQDIVVKNICIDKAAASRVAQTLEKKSIITRIKNKEDKRNFNVFLTEDGQKYINIINEILDSWYDSLCTKASREKIKELTTLLELVNS